MYEEMCEYLVILMKPLDIYVLFDFAPDPFQISQFLDSVIMSIFFFPSTKELCFSHFESNLSCLKKGHRMWSSHGLINYIDSKAKRRQLKKINL
jgi:hypothetical protein